MSIFGPKSESSPGPIPTPPIRRTDPPLGGSAAAVTHIAAGSKIVGEIHGANPVHLEGELEGRVRVDNRVVIGKGGRVKGKVEARTVEIAGKIEGDVRGSDRVEITASGSLAGDVSAPRVVIAEGAFFKGQVEMTGKPAAGQAPAAAVSSRSRSGGSPTAAAGGSAKEKSRSEPGSGEREKP